MTWQTCLLQDLVFLQRGFDITKAQQEEGDVPVISSSGIQSYHTTAKASGPGVIIGRKGTVGSVHYSDVDYWPHDTTLWSKDLKGNDPKFVYYFLKTLSLARFDTGNSNPTLNRNHIHKLQIKKPSRRIQARIADILSTYDDLIENNRRRIALLQRAARELYREWFVRLRFPGHEHVRIVDGVPEGWETTKAFDALEVMSGGTPNTTNPDFWGGEIPFFTPKDATTCVFAYKTEKSLTEFGLKSCNSRLYPKGTIFITARGTVGKINVAQSDMAMNQSCYALRSKNDLSYKFLYFALMEGVNEFRSRANGAVFDAVVIDTFKQIPLVVPSGAIVEEFVKVAGSNIDQIENLIQQNRRLAHARDLLLPRLMNGSIPV